MDLGGEAKPGMDPFQYQKQQLKNIFMNKYLKVSFSLYRVHTSRVLPMAQ